MFDFLLGVLASLIATFIFQWISSLFSSQPRWKGVWHGTANDLTVKQGEEIDNESSISQKVELKITYYAKNKLNVNGNVSTKISTDSEIDSVKGKIKGKGTIHDGIYATFQYSIKGDKFIGFGVGLLQLSGNGRKIIGYFLSRRVATEDFQIKTKAFGKVILRLQH